MSPEDRHADGYKGSGDSDGAYGREWTELEKLHMFPDGWPYRDLPLRLGNCPWCGFAAVGLFVEPIHPVAMCHNPECQVLTWDPTMTAREAVRSFEEDGRRQEEDRR